MANLDRIEKALRAADAAGDVEGARRLAQAYRQEQALVPATAAAPAAAPDAVPPTRRQYGALEVPFEAVVNAPASMGKLISGVAQTIAHPIDTATGIRDVLTGATVLALPKTAQTRLREVATDKDALDRMVNAARAFGGDYADAYGGYENIKRTMAEDPVRVLGDLSVLLGGGAAVTQRIAPRTAAVLEKASQATNPMKAVTRPTGAAVRGGVKGVDYVRNLFSPKNRTYLEAAGGKAPELINAMRDPGLQLIEGSRPTAAQAGSGVNATKFAAMGEAAAKVLPDEYYARELENAAARQAAVQTVGKTPAELENVRKWRAANAGVNYPKAFEVAVKSDRALTDIANDPFVKKALSDAEDLSMSQGVTFKTKPVEYIHNVKLALDKALAKTGDAALSATERGRVQYRKTQLLDWLEKRVPEYKTAREVFARQSRPINQMEVGQFLEGKLVSALDEEAPQRAASFATAVKDAPGTIKKATGGGGPRYTKLSDVLEPDQVAVIEAVREDLARAAKTKGQAKAAGGHAEIDKIVSSMGKVPGMLTPIVTLTNYILGKVQGKMDRALAIQIATEMLDPALAANALEKAQKWKEGGAVGRALKPLAPSVNSLAGIAKKSLESRTGLAAVQVRNAMAEENKNRMSP
jgi:hypothetical protein